MQKRLGHKYVEMHFFFQNIIKKNNNQGFELNIITVYPEQKQQFWIRLIKIIKH